jgi:tetratricopeptide (TPR) repeat protein
MRILLWCLLIACAAPARADDPHAGHALGRVDFPISCALAVRPDFDRALALLHHMTYPQARKAFEEVAARDPDCAMAHWGIAMTYFQPLWPTRPDLAERTIGWHEVERAQALKAPTERERLFITMPAAFFENPASDDYWLRVRRWADATARVHAALPEDPEATVFEALALLATMPADRVSRENADAAATLLLAVHAQNPDHPGAMHYLVHANDVPGREHESLELTRHYEQIAPDNPHALHMPTHVYTRLGDWAGVVRGNQRAAAAALTVPAGDKGQYVWDEYPHAIEYLAYAHLQQGEIDEAIAQRDRLFSTRALQPSFKTAFHLASTQARIPLVQRDWASAAALQPRTPASIDWDKYPWADAILWFAHGMGSAHIGKTAAAESARAQLVVLEAKATAAKETLFARNIAILRLELDSAIAHVAGDNDLALARLREAAALEAATPKHPVTPGPTLPADELLGDLLLDLDRPEEARAAYRAALGRWPGVRHSVDGERRATSAISAADARR